ncbi:MAG TPA: hypothetical protein VFX61_05745, partial [Micromonosporaceae bacterium]|nr:hypothetical protein [Micromonosporaceae bacterium]
MAVSEDRGKSWRTTPVPAPDGELQSAHLALTSSGEAWLFGHREEASFTEIWRFTDVWERVS